MPETSTAGQFDTYAASPKLPFVVEVEGEHLRLAEALMAPGEPGGPPRILKEGPPAFRGMLTKDFRPMEREPSGTRGRVIELRTAVDQAVRESLESRENLRTILGLIDWQVLQSGAWVLDVAYHLTAVLPVEVAETEERRLLGDYHSRMRAAGLDMPDDEEAWTQYREAVAYGLFMWAITRRVDPPIIHRFTDRLGKAAMRHDTFRLLGIV